MVGLGKKNNKNTRDKKNLVTSKMWENQSVLCLLVIAGDTEESSWITVTESRCVTRLIRVTLPPKFFLVHSFTSKKGNIWKVYKFEKIRFVLNINYERYKTYLERIFFYFSLICRLHLGTFAIWVTPESVYHMLFGPK